MANTAHKHETFIWEGLDRQGNRTQGIITGPNLTLVKADLRRQGVNPLKISKKKQSIFNSGKKITPKDIAVFSRQLATMLNAGIPLVQAIDIIAHGQENAQMKMMLLGIKSNIETGHTLSESLSHYPKHFDRLYYSLTHAGEHAGALETILDRIATYKEKLESIKLKVRKAMVYPTVILLIGFVLTAVLLQFVVPQFEQTYKTMNADLPMMTQMLLDASEAFQKWNALIIGGMLMIFILTFKQYKKSDKLRHSIDKLLIKVPILGSVLTKASIARFSRTLSTMFSAGVPLVEALDNVSESAGNSVYSRAIKQIRDEVATGQQIRSAMNNTGLFPPTVTHMVGIGEESGSLDTMLTKVAEYYEEEVDSIVDNLSTLIEPIVMVVIGIIMGVIIVSLYLPMFNLGNVM